MTKSLLLEPNITASKRLWLSKKKIYIYISVVFVAVLLLVMLSAKLQQLSH